MLLFILLVSVSSSSLTLFMHRHILTIRGRKDFAEIAITIGWTHQSSSNMKENEDSSKLNKTRSNFLKLRNLMMIV